jgi:hypothetical protein
MLQPCTQCNRHIVDTEVECPFCGAPNEARPRGTSLLEGRLSRAAVFAAVLAPACVVNDPPPQQYPQQQYQQQPPPPPPDQTYAQPPPNDQGPPPPPDDPPPPVADTAGVHVVVRWNNGNPYVGPIQLHGPAKRMANTDANGEVVVRDLPPGTYQVIVPNNHPRRAPTTQTVVLRNDAVQRVTLTPIMPVYDRSNIPKPYGAPPARKRVV